jgi:hypothetical protein
VTLQERLERLEPRERRLLGVLVAVFAVLVMVLVPAGILTLLGSKRADNEQLGQAIEAVQDGRDRVRKREATREAIRRRYARPTPPLTGFLEGLAKRSSIAIQENQDRAPVPHGKQYEERSTKIVVSQAGMYNLVKFIEHIEQSGHPVRISNLHIRKRGVGNDSYDVQMVVSAFDRKAEDAAKRKGAQQAGETAETEAAEGADRESESDDAEQALEEEQ